MGDLPSYASYDYWNDIWPPDDKGRLVVPVRVGMDNRTGKMLVGWNHVLQSAERLFVTRFHERELREWVGSFVPHLLGENATLPTITRFFWAIATGFELWEPCYKIQRVRLANIDGLQTDPIAEPTTIEKIRAGHITFKMQGVYMPRGHLGDKTPEATRSMFLRGRGTNSWEARTSQ